MESFQILKNITFKLNELEDVVVTKASTLDVFQLYLLDEWAKLAKPLIKQSVKVPHTEKAINKFIKSVDTVMGTYGDIVEKESAEYIEYLYKYSKAKFIKDNKLTPVKKAELPEITPSIWIAADEEAIVALTEMMGQSTSTFYGQSCQKAVSESVKKNIFERNLTTAQAAKAMQKDLTKALRLKDGALESKVIPSGFKGTANQYFSGLVEHNGTMSRTSSALNSLLGVGVKKFKVYSIRSARTCLGCLAMHGKSFTVDDGVKHMNKLLGAESKDDLKEIQPSFHFESKDGYKNKDQLKAKMKEAKGIADAGIALPPYHFRCKCYVDMA